MTTLRIIALSAIITGISATDTPRAEVPVALSQALAGKSGEGLAAVLRRECQPSRLGSIAKITYSFQDPFTGSEVIVTDGVCPDGYTSGTLVPYGWWLATEQYGDTLANDLNNYIPLTVETLHARGDKIPMPLEEVTGSFDRWSVGHALRFGTLVDAYSSPEEMRGRLARAFFYMAVMYPCNTFTPTAYMMMSSGYPYLLKDSSAMLVDWAEQYPPEDAERDWASYASRMQGGYNPFVGMPELYEYIWGEKAGEVYAVPGERVPLHSTYSLADGDRIDLYSPHVPQDAVWSIDGMMAQRTTYDARDLGTGEHTMTFTSPSTGTKGCVMIRVVSESRKDI